MTRVFTFAVPLMLILAGAASSAEPLTLELRTNRTEYLEYEPILAQWTLTNTSDGTAPAFLAVRGDADLNSDGRITMNEKETSIKFAAVAGLFADVAYGALRDVGSVTLARDRFGFRIVAENPSTLAPDPNDFLVTHSSAYPAGFPGNVFRLAGTFKRDHGTITDDGIARSLMADGVTIPKGK
ncbi:MAG: hypothetical protein NTW87_24860 [Planctomycetota bacterium]|nr:hypothetical protein [Planctomycetota bacterium]